VIKAVLSAPGLDGLSLNGDETTQQTPIFVNAFSEARRRGLQTKAHAGELMGPASVSRVSNTACGRRKTTGWWNGWRPRRSLSMSACGPT
jgi:adenosine deaminase